MPTPQSAQAGMQTSSISVRISDKSEFHGFVSALGVAHFLGVQFARIPARFRQAELVHPAGHDGSVDATKYGPISPQPPDNSRESRQHLFVGAPAANPKQSEFDCLRLNIYTPRVVISSEEKVPVLVWIHGGGWAIENGNADFSGDFLVRHSVENKKPIVFVSINYRLGLLGFLSSSELSEEAAQYGEVGWANQGLHDQRLALLWVRNHIHLFGGDGSNVTIAGESAGAWSVLAHLRSDQPLFQRAIIQSAPSWTMILPEEAQLKFNKLLQWAGVPQGATADEKIAALRSVSAEQLIAWNDLLMSPIWDPKWFVGHSSPTSPLDSAEPFPNWVQGIVVGTMRDELSIFGLERFWQTEAMVKSSLNHSLSLPSDPDFSTEVLNEYGILEAGSDTEAVRGFIRVATDACFSRLPYNLARACDSPDSPYLCVYRFDQVDEERNSPLRGKAFHVLDNTYLCRYPAVAGPAAPRSCQATADAFSRMILCHTYGEAPWEPYNLRRLQNVFDGTDTRLEEVRLDDQCWRKFLTTEERVSIFGRLFAALMNNGPKH
ncbi:hypothetical protein LV164_000835 [Aspergillus fumigatus]|nr:hypothetical protein KXX42_009042 [Aspergillus fumigatus]KAH1541586.1 hypothetical protein KXX57_006336 [Aspergillus fumigatus]KAH1983499.1 hypothetical protein KXW88_003433 [Aspergillus fumigatus]KAH2314716.1 hypothetical protein KXV47_002231 [Aspergillus fumigatus]KAH2667737.1 hypothetical protein KXV32_005704 [Aspergillus fumigatus]